MAPFPDGEGPKHRKIVKLIIGWVGLQILGIVLRHFLMALWNAYGPTW